MSKTGSEGQQIIHAVHLAELPEGESPFAAYFAQKGNSGLSFGYNQHDMA